MGCLELEKLKRIKSLGKPKTVDFSKKNLEIVRVYTHDSEMTFIYTPDKVLLNGPRDAEVVVIYKDKGAL